MTAAAFVSAFVEAASQSSTFSIFYLIVLMQLGGESKHNVFSTPAYVINFAGMVKRCGYLITF